MRKDLEGFLHDAASLRELADAIAQFAQAHQTNSVYLDPTTDFLNYVRSLHQKAGAHLESAVKSAALSWRRTFTERRKLALLKEFWREIHSYVNQAVEGHTLQVPVQLIHLIHTQLSRVRQLENAKVVILISPELNYFNYRLAYLENLTEHLADVSGIPRFPKSLGFIAIPYSQPLSLFMNLLVYHEVGHFAYATLAKESDLTGPVEVALTKGDVYQMADGQIQAWMRRVLLCWAEEIYSDLFALELTGPAFTFAAFEFFSLYGVLDATEAVAFSDSHPAPACRFHEHFRSLRATGWIPELRSLRVQQIELLTRLAVLPASDYRYSFYDSPVIGKHLVEAFLSILPTVRRLVRGSFKGPSRAVRDFRTWNPLISQALNHGVVPSRVIRRKKEEFPSPEAVVNSAFCFYLKNLPAFVKTIRTIPEQRPDSPEHRAKWSRRLQLWTLKALEDHRLLVRR
jgi:hypothetical protein